ncbi:MAG: peptide chain release factor 3 [Actinobacteria bacterium]|nr:peptide chain release factor 3 [Actinomycetota bacterium]
MSQPPHTDVTAEAARRRTFAIISHPDAGKTTLTEKFLLYAGAVQEAGAVRARAGRRAATSDWMELEKQRGISISSAVLQFPYRGHTFNLLDTPGHRDFSEDTYRVLAAVDSVVMVLDTAKGIEAQTLKLFQVCRSRNLPVITFFNKYDRPGRDPLELLDEVEEKIGLKPTPVTWPVGIPGDFRGVIDRRTGDFVRFLRTAHGAELSPEEVVSPNEAASAEGAAWMVALDGCSLLDAIGADLDIESYLAGVTTPVFVGSALTNFGVRMLLDAVVDLAPAPEPRVEVNERQRPLDAAFSAFVFKIQANMDPNHRDRLAFARVCSGMFERGMDATCMRSKRLVATKYATTAFGSDRETVEVAFPGDIIGLINANDLRIGDTLYAGDIVEYPGVPRFEPEVFATARPLDSGRFKQFRKGLAQLDEEGVVQVLRDPDLGDGDPILAAVGALQLEVFAHRLAGEFNAPIEVRPTVYQAIRITDRASIPRLRAIGGIRILKRSDEALVALFENKFRLQRLLADEPELTLTPILAGN